MTSDPRVIVALDYPDATSALALASRLDPKSCRLKVGKELFTAAGPAIVGRLADSGFGVFLDLKFHDIPNTVAAACAAAARLGVWMMNVHATGGRAMMSAARAALAQTGKPPLLVAVTLLTSLDAGDMGEVGLNGSPEDAVLRLARLAQGCGLDGVVCSPREAGSLRKELGKSFALVTPGIRPAGAAKNDQQRTATPKQALESGADYLVIGRPITHAADPLAALRRIHDEISQVRS